MKTATIQDFQRILSEHENKVEGAKKCFEYVYGMPFNKIAAKVKAEAKYEYGCRSNDLRLTSNLKILYTDNPNYCQGVRNGYGAGLYLMYPCYGLGYATQKISN